MNATTTRLADDLQMERAVHRDAADAERRALGSEGAYEGVGGLFDAAIALARERDEKEATLIRERARHFTPDGLNAEIRKLAQPLLDYAAKLEQVAAETTTRVQAARDQAVAAELKAPEGIDPARDEIRLESIRALLRAEDPLFVRQMLLTAAAQGGPHLETLRAALTAPELPALFVESQGSALPGSKWRPIVDSDLRRDIMTALGERLGAASSVDLEWAKNRAYVAGIIRRAVE